ncbi:aldehyde dehydrogenase family protein [Streptosporangium sp. NPDC000396]|uniref:aldehyde dehydrogenase family protein n=1 Tax=Streptosporangium sp. NPDC000396 TaxID=3366185 RepID=UPI00367C98A9
MRDASTGEPAFQVPGGGLDSDAALAYGRRVGVSSLRDLDFHSRAALLKELARDLRGHGEELASLAAINGVTPRETDLELRAGLGALRRYADLGVRDFPAANECLEGTAEYLARDGSAAAMRLAVTGTGVAVQFGDWRSPLRSFLDGFGAAFLAGMPTLLQPAAHTALLMEAVVEKALRFGLPEGSLQIYCGTSVLTGGLGAHDVVSSAGPAVSSSAVLGADLEPGTDRFQWLIGHLVAAMTARAGQAPSAVGRVLVPLSLVEALAEEIAAELGEVVVGDPRDPDVRMGPLMDVERRDRALCGAREFLRQGRLVLGSLEAAEKGAFMSPVLVLAASRGRPAVVGPVTAVVSYRSRDELIRALETGPPWFRCEIFTEDEGSARDLTRVAAPFAEAVVFPQASGSLQEQDDSDYLKNIRRHLRTTTVRARPQTVARATGIWIRGADRVVTGTHPLRRGLDELRPGDSLTAGPRRVTREDIAGFAELTGDHYYLHTDEEAARENPMFRGIIAHGYLVVSLAAGLFVTPEPGPVLANYGLENLRFLAPVRPGDELTVEMTVKEITPRPKTASGEVRWDVEVKNQDGVAVVRYDVLTLMARTS